jgi:superfamily II DNA/RNA helicase
LSAIYDQWFGKQSLGEYDPKLQQLRIEIDTLINANPKRKIVVFSSYADTINYLQDSFMENKRTCKFTAADSNALRKEIRRNFDASMKDSEVLDQYDVLFTTDALSEGINLHRAGIVINYDIPYNPTRVIQRVGRINRINKKVFDNIYVFNFFPTLIGEQETRIKQISTLKMNLINAIIGSDTKHLTQEEELKSYFKTEFNIAYASQEELSWDSKHIDNLNIAKKNVDLMETVRNIPRRTRIKRISTEFEGTVVFGKKGNDSIFALAQENLESQVVSVEQALPLFLSNENEKPYEVNKDFSETLSLIRRTLFSKNEVPQIKGRRQKAIEKLNAIKANFPSLANYSRDLIRIIRDFDDISEGALKDLAELKVHPEDSLKDRLNYIISDSVVKNTLSKAERADTAQEVILMVQEHDRS